MCVCRDDAVCDGVGLMTVRDDAMTDGVVV